MSTADDGHLDLDGLADVLAREDEGVDASNAHLAGCVDCRGRLDELRAAHDRVTAELAALGPVSLPADIEARLHDALGEAPPDRRSAKADDVAGETATVTTLPVAAGRPARQWLPAAAAALLLLLAGAGYGVSQLAGGDGAATSASGDAGGAKAAAPQLDLARNSSGTDYTDRASLAAALPALLDGRLAAADAMTTESAPQAAVPAPAATGPQRGSVTLGAPASDPLARLRTDAGLADCLVALLPPDDPSVRPLAIDYATYRGQPALVVVLPGTDTDKLDLYVVGPSCSQANDSLRFYTSVNRP